MRSCVICRTRVRKGSKESFHRLPNDESKDLWLRNMIAAGWRPSPLTLILICSKHFEENCFAQISNYRRVLKKGSVPTIFDGNASQFRKQCNLDNIRGGQPIQDLDFKYVMEDTDSLKESDPLSYAPCTIKKEVDDQGNIEFESDETNHEPKETRHTGARPLTLRGRSWLNGGKQDISSSLPVDEHNTSDSEAIKISPQEIKENVIHDHCYEITSGKMYSLDTSSISKIIVQLLRTKRALKLSQARARVLS